jgi:hypothetical protein
MKKILFTFSLAAALLFSACKDNSYKFLGAWYATIDDSTPMNVSQNGKNFIVEINGTKVPATYDEKNDMLVVDMGKGSSEMIIDKKLNSLLWNGITFTKQAPNTAGK